MFFLNCEVITTILTSHIYVCSLFYMKNIYLRYTETVSIKNTVIAGRIISQTKTQYMFFLKTCCTKLIKKRKLTFKYQKKKSNFSKFFTSKVFEVFKRPTENFNWLKYLKKSSS